MSHPNVQTTEAVQETGTASSTVLKTDGLVKQFGGLTAIDGVDFAIGEGELRCLIGPNGAGKSTFLKLITGAHEPTEGSIYYDGHDVTDLPSHARVDRGISVKFQVPSVYPDLTVEQNLRIPLQRVDGGEAVARRIRETLRRFDLAAERTTTVGDLSHGQQQRLEIGMAMTQDPDVMLLDEPVAGLSVEETEEIADLLLSLNDEGTAFVVIEHDIDFVRTISDRVTVLHRGSIFREGTIEEIEGDEAVRRIYLGEER